VFPRKCAGCGTEIEAGLLCPACRQGFLEQRPFPPVEYLDGGLVLFPYEGCIKKTIHDIKFEGKKSLSCILAEETELLFKVPSVKDTLVKFLSCAGNNPCFVENNNIQLNRAQSGPGKNMPWVWSGVPTDPERLRRRGYDIPFVLFGSRAAEFGGIWKETLYRTRKTLPMYGLGPEERRQNLQGCFTSLQNVRGRPVLLVDDIITTGATFSAAAAVLKKAGAVKVKGLALCGSVENLR